MQPIVPYCIHESALAVANVDPGLGVGNLFQGNKDFQAKLGKYVPVLEKLAKTESGSVKDLKGFKAAWAGAATDPPCPPSSMITEIA